MRQVIEQIIRTQTLPKTQQGYDSLVAQVAFAVHPAEFMDIWVKIDWLSQDGCEGN